MTDRWQARTLTEGQKRPLLHTAGNGWVSPVLLVDLNAFWPDGKPCDDLRWCAPAQDGAVWAAKWRDCEGPAVDLLPWSSDEAEAWLAGRDAVLVVADSLSSEATDSLISAKHERDQAHAWAVAALERCRVLQAQLDSERRHADEMVQRISDVTEALGEHRTPGRPLAEDVRELAHFDSAVRDFRDCEDKLMTARSELAKARQERDETRAALAAIRDALGCEPGGEVGAVRTLDRLHTQAFDNYAGARLERDDAREAASRHAKAAERLSAALTAACRMLGCDVDTLRPPDPGDTLSPASFGKGEAGVLRLAALLNEAPEGAVVECGGRWRWGQDDAGWVGEHGVRSDARGLAIRAPLTVVAWPGGAS